jgi:hypothetical protein
MCFLALPAFAAPGNDQACPLKPLTAAAYADFVKKDEEGVRFVMQSINCYNELLTRASEAKDPRLVAETISLGVPGGTHSQEEYSEFLETLAAKQPRKLFDALLKVDDKYVQEVLRLLNQPLVTDKKEIDTSFSQLIGEPKYKSLLARYSAGVSK